MTASLERIKKFIQKFELQKLFIEELGWNSFSQDINPIYKEKPYPLKAVAEKKGVVPWKS